MIPVELRTRVLTASIAVLLVTLFIGAAATTCVGVQLGLIVVTSVACGCAWEAARLREEQQPWLFAEAALLVWPLICMLVVCWMSDCTPARFLRVIASLLVLTNVGIVALFYYAHWRGRESIDKATQVLAELPMAFWLVSVGGGSMLALLTSAHGAKLLGWMVAVVAVNDIAAYFVGRRFAGPKFAPHLSPNKTVSGCIGGYVGGVVAALSVGALLPAQWSSGQSLLLALFVVTAAQMGDLAKSYLKRKHGKKDTGALLPGHGGLLDRLDGHLASAPLVLAWIVHFST